MGLDPFGLPASVRAVVACVPSPGERREVLIVASLHGAWEGVGASAVPVPDAPRPPAAPPWWGGASADEVLAFDLYPGQPEGSDLALCERSQLEHRLALCVSRGKDPATRTRWLERYAGLVVAEARRRRGAA